MLAAVICVPVNIKTYNLALVRCIFVFCITVGCYEHEH